MLVSCIRCTKKYHSTYKHHPYLCNTCLISELAQSCLSIIRRLDNMTLPQLSTVVKCCNTVIMSGKRMIDIYDKRH